MLKKEIILNHKNYLRYKYLSCTLYSALSKAFKKGRDRQTNRPTPSQKKRHNLWFIIPLQRTK